jgi:hypothetical protein
MSDDLRDATTTQGAARRMTRTEVVHIRGRSSRPPADRQQRRPQPLGGRPIDGTSGA